LICGEIVDPVILEKWQLMSAGQGIRSGLVFTACGILTNTSSADFTNSRFDERKGVIAVYDYMFLQSLKMMLDSKVKYS
jgi:hypothetical protein